MAKALTQYPIFILVLVSLIVLSALTTYFLQEIGTESRQLLNTNIDTDTINYVYVNNTLFIKTKKYYSEVFEIEVLKNNTIIKHILHNYNNTLYGPLILHSNTMRTILFCKDKNYYRLLDIIVYDKPLTNLSISRSYREKYPPAIVINPLLRINTLESINGINKFYVLKPYINVKNIMLRKYHVYNITYDKVVDRNTMPKRIRVYDSELTDSKILDNIFNEYLEKYGNITQYRNYTLNIYKDREYQYKLPETYIFNVSEGNSIIVKSSDKIANVTIKDNYSLLETLLVHRILRIYIRDILGETYIGKAIIKYKLVLVNNASNKKYIYIIKTINTYTNITDEAIKLSLKKIIRDIGEYTVYLDIYYNITVPQPINPPLYVTVTYSLNGGGSGGQAIITYLTDKIIINASSENIVQVPLTNNTLTLIGIHKELLGKNYSLDINNTYLLNTDAYNITYKPLIVKPIRTTIYAYPSITATIADSIQVVDYDRNSLYYLINKSDTYYVIGFYTRNNTLTLTFKYYPIIIDHVKQIRLIVNNTNTLLYSIINDSLMKIYSEKYGFMQSNNLSLYGFYVLNKYVYQEPLLVIDYSLLLKSISYIEITIIYIDNSSQAVNISDNDLVYGVLAYHLYDKPISNISIYMGLRIYNCVLAYSVRLASPIALINTTDNSVVQIRNYYAQNINGVVYYMILFRNEAAIYNIRY